MRKITKFLCLGIITMGLFFTACSKQGTVGPAGKDGTNGIDGTNGTDGMNGNANVKLFEFDGEYDFARYSSQLFPLNISRDSASISFFVAYLVNLGESADIYFSVPGKGNFAITDYDYGYYVSDTVTDFVIYTLDGPGEVYDKIKIYSILSNTANNQKEPLFNGYTVEQVRNMNYETFQRKMIYNQ